MLPSFRYFLLFALILTGCNFSKKPADNPIPQPPAELPIPEQPIIVDPIPAPIPEPPVGDDDEVCEGDDYGDYGTMKDGEDDDCECPTILKDGKGKCGEDDD